MDSSSSLLSEASDSLRDFDGISVGTIGSTIHSFNLGESQHDEIEIIKMQPQTMDTNTEDLNELENHSLLREREVDIDTLPQTKPLHHEIYDYEDDVNQESENDEMPDLFYVTNRIISLVAPKEQEVEIIAVNSRSNKGPIQERDTSIPSPRPQSPSEDQIAVSSKDEDERKIDEKDDQGNYKKAKSKGNCPRKVARYLQKHHANHHLLFNISSTTPSTKISQELNNQIVNLQWDCPGIRTSELQSSDTTAPTAASIPTLRCLLNICYTLDAYLQLHPENVAALYCSNGKTRTGIAFACYLKYIHERTNKKEGISSSLDGFRLFCSKTCQDIVRKEEIDNLIPPSLKTRFINFDSLVECGGPVQAETMFLRAVTLQGLPVEDMPRVDIWDETGLVFSSHSKVDENDVSGTLDLSNDNISIGNGEKGSSIDTNQILQKKFMNRKALWAEDDAFYRVNKKIIGDFLLLSRFGGEFAQDTDDPTKVILRYANNASFLYPSIHEMPKTKVDILRRYADEVAEEDFLMTFLFETVIDSEKVLEASLSNIKVLEQREAFYKGLHTIHEYHVINSTFTAQMPFWKDDVDALQNYYHGGFDVESMRYAAPSSALLLLALQLSNGDISIAVNEYLEKDMKSIWKDTQTPNPFSMPLQSQYSKDIPDIHQSLFTVEEVDSKDIRAFEEFEPPSINRSLSVEVSLSGDNGDDYSISTEGSFLDLVHNVKFQDCVDSEFGTTFREEGRNLLKLPLYEQRGQLNDGDLAQYLGYDDSSSSSETFQTNALSPTLGRRGNKRRNLFDSTFSCKRRSKRGKVIAESEGINRFDETKDILKEKLRNILTQLKLLQPTLENDAQPEDTREVSTDMISTGRIDIDNDEAEFIVTTDMLMQLSHTDLKMDDLKCLLQDANTLSLALALSKETLEIKDKKRCSSTENRQKSKNSDPMRFKSLEIFNSNAESLEEFEIGSQKMSVMIEGKLCEGGKIIAKDGKFYIIRLPASLFQDGKLNINSDQSDKKIDSSDGNTATEMDIEQDKGPRQIDKTKASEGNIAAPQKDASPQIVNASQKEADLTSKNDSHGDPALKDDPEYQKYFKMLKMGLPMGAVQNALQRDAKDPTIMDLDPNKSFKSQQKVDSSNEVGDKDTGVPLKDDPEYQKYFKMLKMGLPMGAVQNALQRDGKDPTIMDLDPNQSVEFQRRPKKADAEEVDTGVPLKDDPEYQKYFKMLKMGLPMGAVQNALQRDGKDPTIMDLDPNQSVEFQRRPKKADAEEVDTGVPLKDDPEYQKYFKMLKMGLPMGAVQNALQRDGKDPTIMDLDPNQSVEFQRRPKKADAEEVDTGVPLKDDPEYQKYFKMLKMGLPMGAVQNALQRDGKDPTIMDLDPNQSVEFQRRPKKADAEEVDTGVPLKDDPEYQKYFKMLKMGLPMGAVQNALQRDGKDPSVMDLDPNQSVDFQLKKKKEGGKITKKEKKPKVRRKKIYWNALDKSKVNKDSLWGKIKGLIGMEKLEIDTTEFENLFTETLDPTQKKKKAASEKNASKQKKSVQVIEGKRGMNGGIILARLKMDFAELARIVDHMVYGKFDSTQLKALYEFLPTDDEAAGLRSYVANATKNKAKREEMMNDLCPCEKYMVAMMGVPNAASKFKCMLFQIQFKSRIEEINESIETLLTACNDVKSSERLQKLMAIILTIGNQINTGGDGNMAAGFTLDALLKLNEAKAFDKKTSVLQYVIKVINKNDPTILKFKEEILSIEKAKNITLDAMLGDLKQLQSELEEVKKAADAEGDKLRGDDGKLTNPNIKMTIAELKEQKTSNRIINGVKYFNQMEHEKEFTPMEIFSQSAEFQVLEATEKTDEVKDGFSSVLNYFGEDDKMSTTDFFGTLSSFLQCFESEKDFFERQEEQRRRDERRAAAKREKEAKKAANTPKKNITSPKINQMDMGSMAAAVALAAQKKNKKAQDDDSNEAMVKKPAAPPMGLGGIAAAAALAAQKKNKKAQDDDSNEAMVKKPAAPPIGLGGIAAAAALAAQKKNKKAQDDDSNEAMVKKPAAPPMGLGGIAAAAALAAQKKNKKAQDDDSNEAMVKKPAAPPIGLGGIAAAAALAAQKKNKKAQDDDSNEAMVKKPAAPPIGLGGIAAAAALAAQKKNKKAQDDDSNEAMVKKPAAPPMGLGGIAAAAALAAQKKNKKAQDDDSNEAMVKKPAAPPIGLGGIAAAAALAAQKKNKKAQDDDSNEAMVKKPAAPPMGLGGIAAAAALAAQKKNKKAQDDDSNEATVKKPAAPPMGLGGIAAAAALAAQKKNKKLNSIEVVRDFEKDMTESDENNDVHDKNKITVNDSPMIIVKPLAKRPNFEKNNEKNEDKNFVNLQRGTYKDSNSTHKTKKKGRQTFNSTVLRPNNLVNEKTTRTNSSEDKKKKNEKPSFNPFAGGGIAAAAALAAQKRSSKAQAQAESEVKESNEDSKEESTDSRPSFNPFAGGGIAAAAALAAQKRSSKAQAQAQAESEVKESNEDSKEESTDSRPSFNLLAGGGIAAAAALVAQKRSSKAQAQAESEVKESNEENTESVSTDSVSRPSFNPLAGGGIAAAAALAAQKRSSKAQAQAQAESEVKESNEDSKEESTDSRPSFNPFAGGGIAAAAALAAQKRSSKAQAQAESEVKESNEDSKEESTDSRPSFNPLAGGGIAAAAALAAQKRSSKAQAQAQAESEVKESNEDSKEESTDSRPSFNPFAGGGIAAAAALAAQKRSSKAQAQAESEVKESNGDSKEESTDSRPSFNPLAGGGIAAAAALAAQKRSSKAQAQAESEVKESNEDSKEESTDSRPSFNPFAGGGIAAAAALAAQKRSSKAQAQAESEVKESNEDSKEESTDSRPSFNPFAGGGIAAAAALAAQKRSSKAQAQAESKVKESNEENTESVSTDSVSRPSFKPLAGGGIAAAAALAAQKRSSKAQAQAQAESEVKESNEDSKEESTDSRPSFNPLAGGGIAAAAALAAQKRSSKAQAQAESEVKESNEDSKEESTDSRPSFNPLAGGGIAAAAALAAQKRSSKAQAQAESEVKESNEDSKGESTDSRPSFNPFAGGGIAAAAALAAQKRSSKAQAQAESEVKESNEDSMIESFAGTEFFDGIPLPTFTASSKSNASKSLRASNSIGSSSDCRDDDSTCSLGDSIGHNPIAAAVAEAARKRLKATKLSLDTDGKILE